MIAYDAPNLASSGHTTHRLNRNGVANHEHHIAHGKYSPTMG